ncbi:hypothetical protein AB0G74_32440 [Streptomyces sp. NPDC020875]|uniref:hypothetical protein n=1 Tax=Streptomyces sp. NPDC020875 TaxID=3154898 RepID=UPI0033E12288
MTITGQTPAPRVRLGKERGDYFVVADGSAVREGRIAWKVLHVERRADDLREGQARKDALRAACRGAEKVLTYRAAVSQAHAAGLARRESTVPAAAARAVRMEEEIRAHQERGACGWIAIRIADGGSDGELYGDCDSARAAQPDPERCAYILVSPRTPWTHAMCEDHLEFVTHEGHECMVYGTPTCRSPRRTYRVAVLRTEFVEFTVQADSPGDARARYRADGVEVGRETGPTGVGSIMLDRQQP